MEVFIGNLPGDATLASLDSFLGGLRLRADFECHSGRDRRANSYHYLVARTAEPEQGRLLIEQLNGRIFEGHAIEAREFIHRRPCADWSGSERRVNVGD